MSFKKFVNYVEERKDGVNAKEGLVGNPKVKVVADYDGPDPKKPTKGEGQGELNSYKSANGNAAAKKPESGGFADMGDKSLKYTPDTEGGDSKLTVLGKELKGEWPKLPKTEQFMRKTKNMSAQQFAEFMVKECSYKTSEDLPMVNAEKAGPFHPHPSEAIRYVAALSSKDERVIEQLVNELKRNQVLGEVFKAALEYPESYRELSALFENEEGEKRAKSFARALKEAVGPPMGLKPGQEDDMDNPHPEMGDEMDDEMGDEESDDMDDDDMDMDDEDDMDMHGADDDLDGDEDDMDDMGDEEMGDEMGDMGGEEEMGPPPKFGKKPGKLSAHSNIMSSMSKMGLN